MPILSLKLVLLSTSVLSTAVILKLSAPAITEFATSQVPSTWSVVVSWLRPPYLYIVINCIIITIAASSKLRHKSYDSPPATFLSPAPVTIPAVTLPDFSVVPYENTYAPPAFGYGYDSNVDVKKTSSSVSDENGGVNSETNDFSVVPYENTYTPPVLGYGYDSNVDVKKTSSSVSDGNGGVNSETNDFSVVPYENTYTPPVFGYGYDSNVDVKKTSSSVSDEYGGVNSETKMTKNVKDLDEETRESHGEIVVSATRSNKTRPTEYSFSGEKPPVSARFAHRKAVKATAPEGGRTQTLGVVWKPKRQDTLEATWKTITEGRPMPLTRHLKKSDTWETPPPHPHHVTDTDHEKMTKSETFTVDSNSSLTRSTGSGKLRKDPSLSQDDLNRRVEAFINKFNEDMRLQRQESLNQYLEMINRGAH